jgi:hypothetical protein
MTSKIVVNNIEADAGVSTVFFNSDIGATDGTLNVDGNLTVDGVITYEDVTNVDSVGIVTAQAGIHVTDGSVGIGTDNPTELLHLAQDSHLRILLKRGGASPSEAIFANEGTYTNISNNSSGVKFSVGSTPESKVVIRSGGVGIGTDNPASLLHLENAAPVFTVKATNASSGLRINVKGQSSGQLFRVQDDNTTKFVLEESGRVGIGTESPVGSLEVRDSKANLIVAKDGLTVKSNSNLHTTYDTLQIGAGGALLSYSTATATADTQFVHNAYRSSGGTFKYRYADTAARLRVNSPGRTWIFESAGSGNADSDIAFSEQLRIDSGGRIAQGGKTPTNHGSPNLLLWGADPTMMIASTGSTNNSSFTGIKFAVAGGSTGDYSKAGIFVQRQDSYNDLDMIFAFRSTNDAAGVEISDEKLRIDSDGNLSVNHNSPNTRLYVRESGATISTGNAILNSTQKGIRLVNSNNDDTSLGLWFTTGDSHHAGISGQRNDSANTWGTDLRFYTHEGATNDLTYARERHRINPNGLLINRKGNNAANTGGTILGRYKYTQQNQGQNYEHNILGPDGRNLTSFLTVNVYAKIRIQVTGTGTNPCFCEYYYTNNQSLGNATLTHVRGNSTAGSNRPYMVLNGQQPRWKMNHTGGYVLDIEVAMYGGKGGYTYTTEYGNFAGNP